MATVVVIDASFIRSLACFFFLCDRVHQLFRLFLAIHALRQPDTEILFAAMLPDIFFLTLRQAHALLL